jgi:penicillin amidase
MMRWLRRLLIAVAILIALVVLLPAGIVGGIVAWLKFSPPATSGQVRLEGLGAPVDLVWDKNAVPHIFAASLRDAYRALGWVHARDRLWQMETQRRIGQGRLSEIIGKPGVDFDREMRVLGLYRLAEANYETLDPDTSADLDAYAAGVNDYLAHPAAPLPIEFQLLHVSPEPWRPADSLVWARLMALQLSSNYREEALRAELVGKVAPDIFKALFPEGPEPGPTTLAALGGMDWRRFAANLPPVLGPDHASNEWVVDGTLTATGKPLLANDPHLGLSAPILWYLARIVTPGGSLAGVTFPGSPYHILGHNDRIAWGMTTTGGDVEDLFVEDVLPNDAGRYRTPDGDAAFETRDEVIKVRFGDDVPIKIRESRHGPVISDIEPELAAAVGKGKAVALSFVGLSRDDTTVQAIRQVDRAHDWPSFQAAIKLWRSPEQNVVYADVDGHIGFTSFGPLPLRKRPTDDLPAPGASGAADWTGLTGFAQLPQGFDPPTHRFINANNRVAPPDFPVYVARRYADPFRAARIAELLDGKTGLTADDFSRMQLDVKEQDTVLLLPRLLTAQPKSPAGQTALALLKAWDGMMAVDRPEPLIYSAWVSRIKQTLVDRAVGGSDGVANNFGRLTIIPLLDHFAQSGPDAAASILAPTLDDSVAGLVAAYGQDLTRWRWGDAHKAALTSQLFGRVPLLGGLFDVGLPAPGGAETIDRAGYGHTDGVHFSDVHGPGYRGVFDLADLDSSHFIIATGQSGSPVSPHYGDMAERWRDGGWITLSGTADQVAASGIGRQRFLP